MISGTATFDTYSQLTKELFARYQGSGSWERDTNKPATFARLPPGEYTVCALPLAGSPNDQALMKRVNAQREAVKVYCTPVRILPAPAEQPVTVELPAMAPLP